MERHELGFTVYICVGCKLHHMPEERRFQTDRSATKCPRCECRGFTKRIVEFGEKMTAEIIPIKQKQDHAQGVQDAFTLLKVLVMGGHSPTTINDVILKGEDSLTKLREQINRR